MKVKNIVEVWYHPGWNKLELVEWNACYCHPNDLTIYRSKSGGSDGWYGWQNKSVITKHRVRTNWIRLERQVKIIKPN